MVWSEAPPLPQGDQEVAYVSAVAVRVVDLLYSEIARLAGPAHLAEVQRLLAAEVKGISAERVGLDSEARALRFALWLVDHTSLDREAPGE